MEDYLAAAAAFLDKAPHPTLGRRLRDCWYVPMVELLRYLEANGFTCFIASGGSRDFMRAVTGELYGIPPERVVGSSNGLEYTDDDHGGSLAYLAQPDVFDDGPVKPVRIWSRIGRRPILAGGNSNGDVPMLRFAGRQGRPALRLLVLHDDPEREFAYVKGAEQALERARAEGWTVVSVKDDWATVFAGRPTASSARVARRARQLHHPPLRCDQAVALLDPVAERRERETGHRDGHPAGLAEPIAGRRGAVDGERVRVGLDELHGDRRRRSAEEHEDLAADLDDPLAPREVLGRAREPEGEGDEPGARIGHPERLR